MAPKTSTKWPLPLLLLHGVARIRAAELLLHSEQHCETQGNLETGRPTCSPRRCKNNVEDTCTFRSAEAAVDHASWLAQLPCKPCEQARHGVCMRLANHLRDAGHVRAAYCNDEFLVILSDGMPASTMTLSHVPQPAEIPIPSLNSSCRVRSALERVHAFKIPLTPVKLDNPLQFAGVGANTIPNALPNSIHLPAHGAIGVAVDGVPLYPSYDANGNPQWISCSLDQCNGRADSTQGYSYVGDPYGPSCLYHDDDYVGGHPPLIGWALDGFALYGRYAPAHAHAYGMREALDACGGHTHELDSITVNAAGNTTTAWTRTYHYHPHVEAGLDSTLEGTPGGPFLYDAFKLAPVGCFGGAINAIPNFWQSDGLRTNHDRSGPPVAYDAQFVPRDAWDGSPPPSPPPSSNTTSPSIEGAGGGVNVNASLAGLRGANDFEQLRPCCGMVHYFLPSSVAQGTAGTGGASGAVGGGPYDTGGAVDGAPDGAAAMAPLPPSTPPVPLPPQIPSPPAPPPNLTAALVGSGMGIGSAFAAVVLLVFSLYLYRRYDGTPEWLGHEWRGKARAVTAARAAYAIKTGEVGAVAGAGGSGGLVPAGAVSAGKGPDDVDSLRAGGRGRGRSIRADGTTPPSPRDRRLAATSTDDAAPRARPTAEDVGSNMPLPNMLDEDERQAVLMQKYYMDERTPYAFTPWPEGAGRPPRPQRPRPPVMPSPPAMCGTVPGGDASHHFGLNAEPGRGWAGRTGRPPLQHGAWHGTYGSQPRGAQPPRTHPMARSPSLYADGGGGKWCGPFDAPFDYRRQQKAPYRV